MDREKYISILEEKDDVSHDAQSFVTNLLVEKPSGRLTAEEALGHPYLGRNKFDEYTLERFENFARRGKIQNVFELHIP